MGLVRTQKGSDHARDTHFLKTAEGGFVRTRRESNQARARGTHFLETARKELVTTRKTTGRGTLTFWRPQKEGLVTTQNESDRGRGTHFLETEKGGTFQDTERKRSSEWHSLSGDSRGRDL